ncbi:MAG: class I SAM-dependent methyltransferase [Saprospiraceae bacterium]
MKDFQTFYESILQDPVTHIPLKFDQKEHCFLSNNGDFFSIVNTIPIILPKETETIKDTSAFDYYNHYKEDAIQFDYFEEYEHPASRFEQNMLHQYIASKVHKSTQTILDIGCGNGWAADMFLPMGKTVISTDIAMTNPLKAIEKYPSPQHFGLVADALHLPIQDESIDIVIAAEIMEHLVDPQKFVQNVYRVIRPGGKILITTPYHEKLEFSLCIHCNQPTPRHAHLHSFHEKNILHLMPKGCLFSTNIFMNKYLLKANTHVLLKYGSFSFWKTMDQWAEKLKPDALRFLIEITKPQT